MAREGYLLHEDEDRIHSEKFELKADTPKKKWDNFWFYHKWHVIVALVVIVLAAFFIHDALSNVKPDYQIGLITQNTYSSDAVELLKNRIEKYGQDLNGDGKVTVQINEYILTDNHSAVQIEQASRVKLSMDINTGASMIFITDDKSLKAAEKDMRLFSYKDGSTPGNTASDIDNMRVKLKDCKKLSGIKYEEKLTSGSYVNSCDSLNISMRIYHQSDIDGNKDLSSYYNASKKLFNKLVN